jgi:hypothetical protein
MPLEERKEALSFLQSQGPEGAGRIRGVIKQIHDSALRGAQVGAAAAARGRFAPSPSPCSLAPGSRSLTHARPRRLRVRFILCTYGPASCAGAKRTVRVLVSTSSAAASRSATDGSIPVFVQRKHGWLPQGSLSPASANFWGLVERPLGGRSGY